MPLMHARCKFFFLYIYMPSSDVEQYVRFVWFSMYRVHVSEGGDCMQVQEFITCSLLI